jgi:NADPH-dependent curcumin reductase CurA
MDCSTDNKLRVLENVARAFPALLLGRNFGKMMVREARQG